MEYFNSETNDKIYLPYKLFK